MKIVGIILLSIGALGSYLQPGRFCNYDACPAKHCSEIPKCKNPFEKFSLPMFDYAYKLALATYGNIK